MTILSAFLLTPALLLPGGDNFVRRRSVLAAPVATTVMSQASSATVAPSTFTFSMNELNVQGAKVPVAIWQPTPASAPSPTSYEYSINIGKIAQGLRVGWLGWLPSFGYNLPVNDAVPAPLPETFGRARAGDAVLFAHGFLGSPFAFAHACEALASDGFVCIAPELPESLSASFAGQGPEEGLTRDEILNAARSLATTSYGASGRWGIFGHSAGAGSARMQGGTYALGRAMLCGGYRGYEGNDPSFIIASDGDGCNAFMARSGVDLRGMMAQEASAGRPTTMFASAADAYSGGGKPSRRGAYIFQEGATEVAAGARLPCHISFLWREVDDAMASLLSPFLPLAKLLGLFVLDFDVYLETRDADATAAVVVPALRRFFLSFSAM